MPPKTNKKETMRVQSFASFNGSKSVFVSQKIEITDDRNVTVYDRDTDESRSVLCDYSNATLPFMLLKSIQFDYSKNWADGSYITFACPNTWTDPFEYYYYDEDKLGGRLYCLSTSYTRGENEEAMWNIFGDPGKQKSILCLKFTELLNELGNCKIAGCNKKPNIQFFVVPIDYSLSKKAFITQNKPLTADPVLNTISHMSYKRKAFKYEDEMRIFAFVSDKKIIANNPDFLRVKVPLLANVLGKVILQPLKPSRRGSLIPDEYVRLQDEANENIRNYWKQKALGNNIRIEQSRRYQTNK